MSAKSNAIEAAKKALPNNVIVATVPTETTQQPGPIGNLKSTPELPMDFEMKRNAIKRADRLDVSLERFEATKKNLQSFKLESETNINQQPFLTIKDLGLFAFATSFFGRARKKQRNPQACAESFGTKNVGNSGIDVQNSGTKKTRQRMLPTGFYSITSILKTYTSRGIRVK